MVLAVWKYRQSQQSPLPGRETKVQRKPNLLGAKPGLTWTFLITKPESKGVAPKYHCGPILSP